MTWVTLEDAKAQLKIPPEDARDDPEVTRVVTEATDVIKRYLGAKADPSWDLPGAGAPPRIQAAVKLMLGYLWTARDDQETAAAVWTAIEALLDRDRDPVVS